MEYTKEVLFTHDPFQSFIHKCLVKEESSKKFISFSEIYAKYGEYLKLRFPKTVTMSYGTFQTEICGLDNGKIRCSKMGILAGYEMPSKF